MAKKKTIKKRSAPLFSLNAKVFLALASIVIAIGILYLGSKDQRILQVPQDTSHTIPDSVHVAHFSSGKIAFIKNGNVWIADNNGRAHPVTNDAAEKISENYPKPLKYRTPVWSPDGKYLAFVQVINYTEEAHILIFDGEKIISKRLGAIGRNQKTAELEGNGLEIAARYFPVVSDSMGDQVLALRKKYGYQPSENNIVPKATIIEAQELKEKYGII